MTPNKRIFLNIVATYGRSLYAMACGIFTSRWVLMALGEVDYGLYGVVGGLICFVSFANGLLSSAVGRFYAFSVGEAKNAATPEAGVEECRKWFNTALMLHSIVPVVLVAIGYPCGEWAVRNFLTIPPDRVEMCVWVWRFACVSGFVSMANVPFQAMYTAKQEIAELTIYSVLATTANVAFLGYMASHPGGWLVRYAFGAMLIAVVPQLVICAMAFRSFPECRVRPKYFFDADRLKKILSFAGCRFVRVVSQVASSQGTAVSVNMMLGPAKNATLAIGNSVLSHVSTFSLAIMNAFSPAITNAAGAGDLERMRRLSFRVCLFDPLMALIFAIPLILEMDEVLITWLKTPPVGLGVFCTCAIIANIVRFTTEGCWMSVHALGRIGWLESIGSLCDFLSFFLAALLLFLGFDVLGVGLALVIANVLLDGVHLWYGRKIGGLSVRLWIRRVAIPLMAVTSLSALPGFLVRRFFDPSFFRIILTTVAVEVVFLPLVWFFVLSPRERDSVVCRFRQVWLKAKRPRNGVK